MVTKHLHSRKVLRILIGVILFVCLGLVLGYALWFRPMLRTPLAEPINLPTIQIKPTAQIKPSEPGSSSSPTVTVLPSKQPLCGNQPDMSILLIGIDSREPGYEYGNSDAIRVIHIDYTKPQIRVVALPRDLVVDIPEDRFDIRGPIKLNEAYFFGTPGMGHYKGAGHGAGALAEVIQYNFGVSVDHYVVVDFQAFVKFIDAIGGIEVNLPTYVDNRPVSFFPAGPQKLNGDQALKLARVRNEIYSDNYRIDLQSIILSAVFMRLKDPHIFTKLPEMFTALHNAVITDFSPQQIGDGICLLRYLDNDNILFFNPPTNMLVSDSEYIPTLNNYVFVFHWDQTLVQWIHNSL
jgi:LCP family protein required for cell wall assembly